MNKPLEKKNLIGKIFPNGYYWLKRAFIENPGYYSVGNIVKYLLNYHLDIYLIGRENLPKYPAIVVPNHTTCVDGSLLGIYLKDLGRRTNFLVQGEGLYSSTPGESEEKQKSMQKMLKFFLWVGGMIPVGMDKRSSEFIAFERIREHLEYGRNNIGVFSEGSSKNLIIPNAGGQMISIEERKHYKTAARLAIEYDIPIVPIGLRITENIEKVSGKYGFFNIGESWKFVRDYYHKHGKIPYCINMGKPLWDSQIGNIGERRKELTERVRQEVISLYNRAGEVVNSRL